MHIPFGDAFFLHIITDLDPFLFGQAAVKIRVIQFPIGGILAHEGKEHLTAGEGVGHPVDHPQRVFHIPRQDEVADEHAGAEQAVFHDVVPCLSVHFHNGVPRDLRIVGSVRELLGQCRVGKLTVGQIDIHLALEFFQGIDRLKG